MAGSGLFSPLLRWFLTKVLEAGSDRAEDLKERIYGPPTGINQLIDETVAKAYKKTIKIIVDSYIKESSGRIFVTDFEREEREHLKEHLNEFNNLDIKKVAAEMRSLTRALAVSLDDPQIGPELFALIDSHFTSLPEGLRIRLYERIQYRFAEVFLNEISRSFTKKQQSAWIGFILLRRQEEQKQHAIFHENLDFVHNLITEFKSRSAQPFIPDPTPVSKPILTNHLERGRIIEMSTQYLIPRPPQPYFAHTYNLKRDFSGRINERTKLSEWLSHDATSVFPIINFGGMGKSALAWVWLHSDVLGERVPDLVQDQSEAATCHVAEDSRPTGILWWSFYESDAHFDVFLDSALQYASGGAIQPNSIRPHERVRALVEILHAEKFLFVLDGFEFELKDYAGFNAAYMGDDVEVGAIRDSLACSSPLAADFLSRISSTPLASRVLITSRLLPKDLKGKSFCHVPEELAGLTMEEATAFFSARGVKARPAEIRRTGAAEGYHPLSLHLLAGLIVDDKEHSGNIRVLSKYPTPELRRERHNIFQAACDALSKEAQELLTRLSIFRGSMTYKDLSIFDEDSNNQDFDALLSELIDRGFLFRSSDKDRFDMHQVVRSFAYKQLDLDEKKLASAKLADLTLSTTDVAAEELQNLSQGSLELTGLLTSDGGPKVQRLSDLDRIMNLYNYKIDAGLYDEAFALYRNRLARPLYHRFAANDYIIALLRRLFPDGEGALPQLKDPESQHWVMNELATAYSRFGQPDRSVALRKLLIGLLEQTDKKLELAISLKNLGHMDQVMLGAFNAAQKNIERGIALLRECENTFQEAVGHLELAHLLIFEGAYEEADLELNTALVLFKGLNDERGAMITYPYHAWRFFLMGQFPEALEAAREALRRAEEYRSERNILRAKWVLGASLISLSESATNREELLREAENLLTEAQSQCSANQADMEPDVLRNLALCYRAQGKLKQSQEYAQEALETARRWGARLKEAEAANVLALLALDEGNKTLARKFAETAKLFAKSVDSEDCYKCEMLKAEQLLEHC
jgi:tetratricopeptide (TPR) repeat protein